ncbi:MAG: hypothetical protein QOH00_3163, partial [Gaiellales bacterium]|nr:hypothetical protein [Gaiellales bacterium]
MIDGIDSSIRDQLAAELNGVPVAAPSWADVVRRSGKAPLSRHRGWMARWWRRPLAVGVAAAL